MCCSRFRGCVIGSVRGGVIVDSEGMLEGLLDCLFVAL